MILPSRSIAPSDVADHYDELDVFYREVWGEHVHHGLWRTGRESDVEAAEQLVTYLADVIALRHGERVVDIGAGYGATARLLAERYAADVTAFTVSRAQYEIAAAKPAAPGVRYLLRDWLRNDLPSESADAAIAIESTEHMLDKAGAFVEAHRVLRAGGRLAVCAWIARERPSRWEERYLLEPICREGRLAGMGSESEYRALLADAGFTDVRVEDLTVAVKRTWPKCARGVGVRLLRDARYRHFLFDRASRNRVFALTLLRIWTAYETGAMRYLLFVARKP
ncbi:MAG TPA: class I SAM-dependent methyltransferase [Gemmatimonadaceae bacterium]|nr:class I SAM-dependent methyltransferase [Gemmatimonadaceae bacterium]